MRDYDPVNARRAIAAAMVNGALTPDDYLSRQVERLRTSTNFSALADLDRLDVTIARELDALAELESA